MTTGRINQVASLHFERFYPLSVHSDRCTRPTCIHFKPTLVCRCNRIAGLTDPVRPAKSNKFGELNHLRQLALSHTLSVPQTVRYRGNGAAFAAFRLVSKICGLCILKPAFCSFAKQFTDHQATVLTVFQLS
jgi:hypothetical protein